MNRIQTIDFMRGIIMIIMAIDHASFFVGKIRFNEFWGIDLSSNNETIWFYTRLISHICAPGFFFLMGIGVLFLAQSRLKSGWSNFRIKRFLITRGLILIIIEMILVAPAWIMGDVFSTIETAKTKLPGIEGPIFGNFGILSSLGASMILTSFLIQVDKKWLLLLSIAGIIGSYLYVNSLPVHFDQARYFGSILLIPGNWSPISVNYSILPWLFICLLGVVWGKDYKENPDKIFQQTFLMGLSMVLLFIILRFLHLGNFQMDHFEGIISFLTIIKYPASIAFILLTLGVFFMLFSVFSKLRIPSAINTPVIVFGRTALFFYIIHLYIYLLIGLLFPYGSSFMMMCISWLGGLAILCFICNRYYEFKLKKDINSIWRFF